MTKNIKSILDIQDQYDTYFVDLVGVIYDGIIPFIDAIEALNTLIHANKQIIFVSNNPRPSTIATDKLHEFGIRGNFHVVTSGDHMRHRLTTDLADLTFYHLGAAKNSDLLKNLPTKTTSSLNLADAVLLSIFLNQEEDTSVYDNELELIHKSGKPIYCPNPDRRAFFGDDLRYTAGYFADKIITLGGNVISVGKPSLDMYDFAAQFISPLPLDKKRILMIGDTLETDIQGARNFGIDSLLVLSGISGLKNNSNSSAAVEEFHPCPTYVMPSLRI